MGVTTSYRSASLLCAERENLAVAIWLNSPSLTDVRAVVEQAELLKASFDGRSMMINAVLGRRPGDDPVRPDFSAEVRKALIKFAKRDDMHTIATAHLVLADGFVGAAVRTFLNTITLVARPKTPMHAFASIVDTADWLAECEGAERWSAKGIRMFFEEVKALR